MASIDDQKGANAPSGSDASPAGGSKPEVSYAQKVDDSYGTSEDGYPYEGGGSSAPAATATTTAVATTPSSPSVPVKSGGGGGKRPPDPPSGGDGGDEEEDGML